MAARLFDIAPQLWQYLDEYDRVAFRSISRDGRRAHDCLLEHLCIHDLWGRQSEAWPAEMESGIRDMLHRGCRPCALMLRFQGPASEQEHLARGLAVLSALADPNTARSSRAAAAGPATESSVTGVVTALEAAAPLPEHKDSALDEDSTAVDCSTVPPSITELRLEGVPLSESTVRAVRSAMPHLRSLKLYHYPMCYPHDHLPAASRTRTGQDELAKDAAAEDSGRRSVQGRGGSGGGGGGGSGVAAAVHALRSSLRSVRLHHCISIHGCTCGQQDADTIVSLDAPGGSARSGEQAAGSCVELEASEGSRSRVAAARCYGCRLGELVEALRSCRQLQHLGLRFTTTPSTTAQPSQEAMRAKEGSHHIHNRIVRERATAGPQPAILPLLLSQLTHLRSLKLQAQSQLPPELVLSAGLGDSLAHLPGLTRLVLGARLGLNSLAPLLLQPSTATAMSYLRDLDAPGCCVDSVGEVRALAGLSHLTRLSVGGFAHCLAAAFSSEGAAAVAASPGTRGGEGEGVTAVGGEGNVAAAVQAAPALSRLTLADKSGVPAVVLQQQQPLPLPLPPALCELSVASPLSPELLLLMHRPRCLATLRTTGFELGQQHVAAALPRAACLGLGDVGPQESEGRAFPGVALAVASTAAMEALAVAVRVLSGRDQLGTCGLSACSGSSSSSSTGGSLGAPGAHEEWGGRGAEGLAGAGVLFAYRDLGIELHVGYQGPPNALGGREYLAGCEVDRWGQAVGAGGEGAVKGGAGGGGEDGGGGAWPMGHGTWLVELRPLRLHGLQLEGLVLQEADVRCIAEGLEHLEDLRLDCGYPLHALPLLRCLRRLVRLQLNAAFWGPPHVVPATRALTQLCGDGRTSRGGAFESEHPSKRDQDAESVGSWGGVDDASAPCGVAEGAGEGEGRGAAAGACGAQPGCSLREVALSPRGKASGRLCTMQVVVGVEAALPDSVGAGVVRLWVCP